MDKRVSDFPARVEAYTDIIAFVLQCAADVGLSLPKVDFLQLGLEEAVVNVINYAYPGREGKLWLSVWCEKRQFCVELKDNGEPFDPLNRSKMGADGLSRAGIKQGGLGIAFIKRVFDEVRYNYDNGANVLLMTMNVK